MPFYFLSGFKSVYRSQSLFFLRLSFSHLALSPRFNREHSNNSWLSVPHAFIETHSLAAVDRSSLRHEDPKPPGLSERLQPHAARSSRADDKKGNILMLVSKLWLSLYDWRHYRGLHERCLGLYYNLFAVNHLTSTGRNPSITQFIFDSVNCLMPSVEVILMNDPNLKI